jgi:hypothetical protein
MGVRKGMHRPDLNELLSECLDLLQKGVGLDEVLARYQPWADQLRPLLEAAWLAHTRDVDASAMTVAQVRSRARFLGAASLRRKTAQKPGFRLAGMRMAGAVALVFVVLFASLLGTGLGSAEAVPGEALYPVKRAVEQAQMALTTRQSSRLELEEAFDLRRSQEAEKLVGSGRTEKVTFAGFLWQDAQQSWFVDEVPLILTPDQEAMARTLNGSYVEVKGEVRGESGVEVKELKLRLFQLSGTLEKIAGEEWIVSGIKVQIQPSTQLVGNPQTGMQVELTALRLGDGNFLALSVKLKKQGSSKNELDSELNQYNSEVEIENVETPELVSTLKSTDVDSDGKDDKDRESLKTPEPDDDEEEETPEIKSSSSGSSKQTSTPQFDGTDADNSGSDDHEETSEPTD